MIAPRQDVDPSIASHLAGGLYTSIPIFLGGVINSIAVASVAALRHPAELFILWAAVEVVLGIGRDHRCRSELPWPRSAHFLARFSPKWTIPPFRRLIES